jgi:hypothetical protein
MGPAGFTRPAISAIAAVRKRAKRVVRTFLIGAFTATFGCLLAAVAFEGLLRFTEDGRVWKRPFQEMGPVLIQRPAAIFDPRTAARFMPNWSGAFYFSGRAESVLVRTNSLGFRSPEYAEEKPAGVTRVALVGDSLIAGLQVEADVHFRALVEGGLGASRPTQVLNFGVPGTGPVTHLHVYRDYARRFRPDAVVLGVFTDNDFTDNVNIRWRDESGQLTDAPFKGAPGDFGKFLKANSCAVMAVSALKAGRLVRKGKGAAEQEPADAAAVAALDAKPSHELAAVSQVAYDKAVAVWDELVGEMLADQLPVVVVIFPDHAACANGTGWDYARPATKLLHQRLAQHFRERGAAVISGTDMFERHTARYGAMSFQGWKSYLSAAAHQTLADLIVARLQPRLAGR